jgi:hypothetical protein
MGMFGDIGGFIGGVVGDQKARKNDRRSYEEMMAALRELEGLPGLDEAKADFQAGESAYGDIAEDPRLRAQQLSALDRMSEVSRGGLTTGDRVGLSEAQRTLNENERGQRGAIVQDAAMRGQGGQGTELAAKLAAQQGNANRANQFGGQAAAAAQMRALQAIEASGQMAGSVRGQDWKQDAEKAAAKDRIGVFNAGARSNAYNYNADRAGMVAGQHNVLGGKYQDIADSQRRRYAGYGRGIGETGEQIGKAFGDQITGFDAWGGM